MVNPSRSMGSLKGFCTTKAKALDDFLDSVKDRDITSSDVTIIKELRQALKEQFDRMHLKWEAFITADPDPFENDEVFTKCKKDYDESQVLVDKHMVVSKIALDRALSDGAPQAEGATGATNIKIDETLKPKELLATSMTLEEADEWFRGYKAFLKHNERALRKLDVQVNRALLNKSIEAKLSSALRALPGVLDTTSITDPDGCLEKLRSIFLDKNLLLLRRHYYFKRFQGDHETVNEWWAKKIDKARECALATITADEIRMLELIRGVKSFKLRQEFLRQSDPTLEGLLKIAKNWQVADDVEKGLGATSTVDSRKSLATKKTSLQSGKARLDQAKLKVLVPVLVLAKTVKEPNVAGVEDLAIQETNALQGRRRVTNVVLLATSQLYVGVEDQKRSPEAGQEAVREAGEVSRPPKPVKMELVSDQVGSRWTRTTLSLKFDVVEWLHVHSMMQKQPP